MDKQTYKQRVEDLAKEMALDYNTKEKSNYEYRDWIHYLSTARIAIAKTASAVRQALYEHNITNGGNYRTNYLIKKGLIPDNAPSGLQIGVLQPGEPGYGGYNPDNPPPEPCPHELRCHTRNHPEGTCDCHNMGILPDNAQEGETHGTI